jgi:NitT/TauT family transport system permease protein
MTILQTFAAIWLPNRRLSRGTLRLMVALQSASALVAWTLAPLRALPQPVEVLRALQALWRERGLGRELATSLAVNVEAIAWTTAISLPLAYLTVVPVVRPLATAVAQARFLGLAGLTFVFTLLLGGGRPLKVALLSFGMTVFLVTSMSDVVAAIPREAFDHARTLRMSEWRVVGEVVVLGTADRAAEALRQNAAIGWMMLPMVEGLVRSQGGLGALLLDQNKHFHLAEVFAIQLAILAVGMLQDKAFVAVRRALLPWAELTLERTSG